MVIFGRFGPQLDVFGPSGNDFGHSGRFTIILVILAHSGVVLGGSARFTRLSDDSGTDKVRVGDFF